MRQVFQFHKGTIRTVIPARKNSLQLYFNSIKVRLEQAGLQGPDRKALISIP